MHVHMYMYMCIRSMDKFMQRSWLTSYEFPMLPKGPMMAWKRTLGGRSVAARMKSRRLRILLRPPCEATWRKRRASAEVQFCTLVARAWKLPPPKWGLRRGGGEWRRQRAGGTVMRCVLDSHSLNHVS